MTEVIKALRERCDRLRATLRRTPEFRELELLEGFIRQYEAVASSTDHLGPMRQQMQATEKRTRRSTKPTLGDAAAAAITDAGHPLPLHDLFIELPKHGKAPTGKRPEINLSSALSRDKRFESVSWRGSNAWWFRGREIPSEADASGGEAADAPAAGSEEEDRMELDRAAA